MSLNNVNKSGASRTQYYQADAREKKDLNRKHEAEMNKIKTTQHQETEQLRSEHRQQIIAEKDRQADALTRLRNELDRTQKQLTDQKDFLVESHQKNVSEFQEKQNEKLDIGEKHFADKLASQKTRHEDVMHKANISFNQDQNDKFIAQKEALALIDNKTQLDLSERTSQVNTRTQHEHKVGEEQIRNLKKEKHHQFQAEDSEWKNKIRQQNTSNQIEFQRQDKLWKKTINDELSNHQQLYANILDQQKNEIKNQADLYLKENEKLKTAASSQLNHIMEKTSDPFYRNNSIMPEVKDVGNAYQLTIDVADHEKDRYMLNAHERTLTLSFSRDFQHDIKQPDNISKTRRVESYNHSFNVADIVKPNAVVKNYDNGKLTFTIKKA